MYVVLHLKDFSGERGIKKVHYGTGTEYMSVSVYKNFTPNSNSSQLTTDCVLQNMLKE